MTKRFGFTLAEVLITLGIIGIVAALTVPALIQNYNTKTWNSAATIFERKLEEALKIMNTQQTLTGHTTTESFVEELSKHFKTNKICQNNALLDCFPKTVYWGGGDAIPEEVNIEELTIAKHFGQKEWNTNIVGVQFANGVSALIAYNPLTTGDDACNQDPHSNQITGENCLAILYDTSGEKNPNTSGKDLRTNKKITKLGKGCFAELNGVCILSTPFIPTPVSKTECEQMISTHGIKSCHYDNDYWAGAVKECGGVSNMATRNDLAKIATHIYNNENITPNGSISSGLIFNPDKSTELGLPDSSFYIWSGEGGSNNYVNYRQFTAEGTIWHYTYRSSSIPLALCIGDR